MSDNRLPIEPPCSEAEKALWLKQCGRVARPVTGIIAQPKPTPEQVMRALMAYDIDMDGKEPTLANRVIAMRNALLSIM